MIVQQTIQSAGFFTSLRCLVQWLREHIGNGSADLKIRRSLRYITMSTEYKKNGEQFQEEGKHVEMSKNHI